MTDTPLETAPAGPAPAEPVRSRIEVPADPRDLLGDFPHRFEVQIRFGDTDAMGHTNNSRFLTFCESSRIDYWEAATGEPFGLVTHGAEESLILAEIRVTYRSPSYFGELLTVESRLGRLGRTSFTLEHRVTASESRTGARAAGRDRGGRPGPLRLRHGAPAGHPRRGGRAPRGLRGTAPPGLRADRGACAGPRPVRRTHDCRTAMTRACAGRTAKAPDRCMRPLNLPPTRVPRTLTTAGTDIHAWHARRAAPPADRAPNVGAVLSTERRSERRSERPGAPPPTPRSGGRS